MVSIDRGEEHQWPRPVFERADRTSDAPDVRYDSVVGARIAGVKLSNGEAQLVGHVLRSVAEASGDSESARAWSGAETGSRDLALSDAPEPPHDVGRHTDAAAAYRALAADEKDADLPHNALELAALRDEHAG